MVNEQALKKCTQKGQSQMFKCRIMGVTPCTVPALCENQAILDPFSMMAKVTGVTTVFPDTGLPRFLLSPKTQTMSEHKLCFTLTIQNAVSFSIQICCFALWTYAPPVVGGFQVVTGNLTYYWALCRNGSAS